MVGPVGARLKITFKFDEQGSQLGLRKLKGDEDLRDTNSIDYLKEDVVFQGTLTRNQLAHLKETTRKDLEKIREGLGAIGALGQSETSAGRALKKLSERGWRILTALVDVGALNEVTAICRECCPNWAKPAWQSDAILPPLVVAQSRLEDAIPIEILPLFDPAPAPDLPANRDDVGRLACRFLGFSSVVQRQQIVRRGPPLPELGRRIENRPQLPIAPFFYQGLPTLSQHQEYFRDKLTNIVLQPAWPAADCPRESEAIALKLATRVWNVSDEQVPQIAYFFCHCDTEAKISEQHALRFNTGSGRLFSAGERRVELGDLSSVLDRLRYETPKDDQKNRALIFLNACASAAINPSGVGSFPQVFSDHRFLGFIGTESAVPDAFASTFAQDFFRRIVEGAPLGHALHQARWSMLRTHLNPLGLLYSAYADPDIRVRYPMSHEDFKTTTTGATDPNQIHPAPY